MGLLGCIVGARYFYLRAAYRA